MAFHLDPAFADLLLLVIELFGLPCELFGDDADLPGAFLDLGRAATQVGLALGQGASHLSDLPLPVDDLLAEGGDRQAMLVARPIQSCVLLAHLLGFGEDLAAQFFEVVAPCRA